MSTTGGDVMQLVLIFGAALLGAALLAAVLLGAERRRLRRALTQLAGEALRLVAADPILGESAGTPIPAMGRLDIARELHGLLGLPPPPESAAQEPSPRDLQRLSARLGQAREQLLRAYHLSAPGPLHEHVREALALLGAGMP